MKEDCKMSVRVSIGEAMEEGFFTNVTHFIFPNINKYSNILPDIDFFYQFW
jgi:hypothetical protein